MSHSLRCLATVILFAVSAGKVSAAEPNWEAYNRLLKTHVSAGELNGIKLHVVDYNAVKQDTDFAASLNLIEQFDTELLESQQGNKGQPRYKPPFPANFGL